MRIEKIKAENNSIVIAVEDEQNKIRFRISLDDFLRLGCKKGQELDQQKFESLQKAHRYYFCYRKCCNKLQLKDYSVKEISDYLDKYVDLLADEKEKIINDLISQNFLRDELTAESQLYCDQVKLIGKKKSAYKMRKRGIDKQIIDDTLSKIDNEEEMQRGIIKGKQLLKTIKNKSYKETIYYLRNKLSEEGFGNIDEIMSDLAVEYDQEKEVSALIYQMKKISRLYKKRYSKKALSSAYYKYLLSKGFESNLIAQELAKENENEDM
ncbi:MAG: RecX family transcriptional regulator [Erysipelotrichia bacterium]|nr:RecX family transcriptional regulator [Erysipelotrichia bacterium]